MLTLRIKSKAIIPIRHCCFWLEIDVNKLNGAESFTHDWKRSELQNYFLSVPLYLKRSIEEHLRQKRSIKEHFFTKFLNRGIKVERITRWEACISEPQISSLSYLHLWVKYPMYILVYVRYWLGKCEANTRRLIKIDEIWSVSNILCNL